MSDENIEYADFPAEPLTLDFATVNGTLEILTDAAELLKEKDGSTGFDGSVALLIEQAMQRLKSIDPAPAQPLRTPPAPHDDCCASLHDFGKCNCEGAK